MKININNIDFDNEDYTDCSYIGVKREKNERKKEQMQKNKKAQNGNNIKQ